MSFAGEPPDAADLSRRWHAMLAAARGIVATLPPAEVGRCVLDRSGILFAGDIDALRLALTRGGVVFHAGRIRGALPHVKE